MFKTWWKYLVIYAVIDIFYVIPLKSAWEIRQPAKGDAVCKWIWSPLKRELAVSLKRDDADWRVDWYRWCYEPTWISKCATSSRVRLRLCIEPNGFAILCGWGGCGDTSDAHSDPHHASVWWKAYKHSSQRIKATAAERPLSAWLPAVFSRKRANMHWDLRHPRFGDALSGICWLETDEREKCTRT